MIYLLTTETYGHLRHAGEYLRKSYLFYTYTVNENHTMCIPTPLIIMGRMGIRIRFVRRGRNVMHFFYSSPQTLRGWYALFIFYSFFNEVISIKKKISLLPFYCGPIFTYPSEFNERTSKTTKRF